MKRSEYNRLELALLATFAGCVATSLVGYVLFVLPPFGPTNLERLSQFPHLIRFYGIAFSFFGQGLVWAGAFVLLVYLTLRSRFRWLLALAAVYATSLAAETMGTAYGLPFGPYTYTDLLGPKLFGLVPMLIPISWFLMAVPSYAFARHAFSENGLWARLGRLLLGACFVTIWDLSLDPAMSYITPYWVWGADGIYYGMPLINLVGWLLTGILLMAALDITRSGNWVASLSTRWLAGYYGLTLLLPVGMAAANGLWLPIVLTLVGLGIVSTVYLAAGRARSAAAVSDEAREIAVTKTELGQFFESHSRSFSFASRWLSRSERERVSLLYAFCRTTDDIVDHPGDRSPEAVRQRLDNWEELALRAYRGSSSGVPWLDRFMHLSRAYNVPEALIRDLVSGVRMDLDPVEINDVHELDAYSYHVASVVGVWMCYLFGIHTQWVIECAVALGRAMQLTNILRDVGEDLRQGRLYLPKDLLDEYGITRASIRSMQSKGAVSEPYQSLTRALMSLAEEKYERAWEGIPYLPRRMRRAVAVAAEVYRSIHERIVENDFDNLNTRAYTSLVRKVRTSYNALLRVRKMTREIDQDNAETSASPKTNGGAPRVGMGVIGLLALTLTVGGTLRAQEPTRSKAGEYAEIHRAYVAGASDAGAITDGLTLIQETDASRPVSAAYQAAFEILKAKHTLWPWAKLRHVRRALPVLDSLTTHYPENIQVRYLRLASCYFLPRILHRDWSVEEDFEQLAVQLPEARDRFSASYFGEVAAFVLERGEINTKARVDLTLALHERSVIPGPHVARRPVEPSSIKHN